jgi:hypothetical protein
VWEDGVFNEYSRQNLPLSVRLRGFSDRLLSRLYNMQLDQVAELTRQDVVELVSEIRCEPIALGNVIANWTGPYMPPRSYFAAMPLVAGPEFVRFWPDEINGIEPIDASDATAAEQWVFGNVAESPTRVGIFTMIQLSEAEEELEETQPTLEQRLTERIDKAKRYVDAQAEQMQRFFDEKLVDLGMQVVEQRQRTRRIVANLGFPSSWKIPEPKLITEPSDQSDESAGGVVGSTDQSSTLPLDESTTVDHVVPYRHRLDPASFEDVQRVTRIWSNAVERYPAAYSVLVEDRISDQLAATLNATLPAAHREVYTRSGKADIFIEANALAAGAGPDKIFICETKWVTRKKWVIEGVDPQLYGYLTTHDTSAMLLLLFRQQDFQSARSRAYGWLQSIDGYVDKEPGAVEDWPIFLYVHGPYEVRLCVASVHLPPTDPADDSPEAGHE